MPQFLKEASTDFVSRYIGLKECLGIPAASTRRGFLTRLT